MSDKDQFTFEDDDDLQETDLNAKNEPQESELDNGDFPGTLLDDQNESQDLGLSFDDEFPETDLSAAFAEGEHSAENSDPNFTMQEVKGGGNSRTRILLLVLLLVIAGGGGAYYFMGLGETTPSVPSVPVPTQKAKKTIALPAKPVKKDAAPAKAEIVTKPAAKSVTVAVPPPPAVAEPVAKDVQTKQADTATVTMTPPKKAPAGKVVETKSTPTSVPVPQKTEVSMPSAPAPSVSTKPTEASMQAASGAFALDAGSYLLESNRDAIVAKIKKLGYEPFVTPVHATLEMTRLRLGTFSKDEVQEALDFARSIEPGAYSSPAGDGYVVYAGTFLQASNVKKLSQRFVDEGIKVHPEPVQVVRTLNRVRFGSFATKEDAAAASKEVGEGGLKASVVKSK